MGPFFIQSLSGRSAKSTFLEKAPTRTFLMATLIYPVTMARRGYTPYSIIRFLASKVRMARAVDPIVPKAGVSLSNSSLAGEQMLMKETPTREGILFQRPMKTGSTTMTGIVLRLVHNRGQQQYGFDKCRHRSIHGSAEKFEFGKRNPKKSFLFSIIRHPTKKAISQFFVSDLC